MMFSWSAVITIIGAILGQPTITSSQWNTSSVRSSQCPLECSCMRAQDGHMFSLTDTTLSSTATEISGQITVDCINKDLIMIPAGISEDTQVLLLSRNNIQHTVLTLPDAIYVDLSYNEIRGIGAITAPVLHVLDLSHNRIQVVPTGVLTQLTKLTTLNLQHNDIHSLGFTAFELENLEVLDLRSNQLSILRAVHFGAMPSLKELRLSHNRIATLAKGSLPQLSSLKTFALNGNKIIMLSDRILRKVDNITKLDMSHNELTSLQESGLESLTQLKHINLNGNKFEILERKSIANLPSLVYVRLCSLPNLRSVEDSALYNLSSLILVELCNNPIMSYVSPSALTDCGNLRRLFLNQNNLTRLSNIMWQHHLPNLDEISLYDNPLVCDCNLKWLKHLRIDSTTPNVTTTPLLLHSNHTSCTYENDTKSSQTITYKLLSQLPDTCKPSIIPPLSTTVQPKLGSFVTLSCRIFGIPQPNVTWTLPSGKRISYNETSAKKSKRVDVDKSSSLHISYITTPDSGRYSCVTINSHGAVRMSLYVHVDVMNIHIFPTAVSSNLVTLSWNGTNPIATQYRILYRAVSPHPSIPSTLDYANLDRRSEQKYEVVIIKPLLHYYTIDSLSPSTTYEFCIAENHPISSQRMSTTSDHVIMRRHTLSTFMSATEMSRSKLQDGLEIIIRCTNVETAGSSYITLGMRKNYWILISLVLLVAVVLSSCIVSCVYRCYHRKMKRKKDYFSDHMSTLFIESIDGSSDILPVTYENYAADMMSEDGGSSSLLGLQIGGSEYWSLCAGEDGELTGGEGSGRGSRSSRGSHSVTSWESRCTCRELRMADMLRQQQRQQEQLQCRPSTGDGNNVMTVTAESHGQQNMCVRGDKQIVNPQTPTTNTSKDVSIMNSKSCRPSILTQSMVEGRTG